VTSPKHSGLKVYGVFAGVGGLEEGLRQARHHTIGLCESNENAQHVLQQRFGLVAASDVLKLELPDDVDLLAGGFPCQDLSQAGRTAGIHGAQSGLVARVFKLLAKKTAPKWVLLENVPNMLRLHRGRAIHFITHELGRLGYDWAYRVIDTRAFGLPQRRLRTFILASKVADPAGMLLGPQEELNWPADDRTPDADAFGFYWTEGNSGVGWAKESVPPLKGGSGFGIASPPAIWLRDWAGARARIVVPSIQDAERMQGFPKAEWTRLPDDVPQRARWRLVGNAVSVPVSKWIGEQIAQGESKAPAGTRFDPGSGARWPNAAYGNSERIVAVESSVAPVAVKAPKLLSSFLNRATAEPLSHAAANGFFTRLEKSGLHVPDEFRKALRAHIAEMKGDRAAA
jgi:DNA (cytosine-5)-methyltransferase 1